MPAYLSNRRPIALPLPPHHRPTAAYISTASPRHPAPTSSKADAPLIRPHAEVVLCRCHTPNCRWPTVLFVLRYCPVRSDHISACYFFHPPYVFAATTLRDRGYNIKDTNLEGKYRDWQKKLHPDPVHSKSELQLEGIHVDEEKTINDPELLMEEWHEESYPPWARRPGYIVSQDIAKEVYRKHKRGELKMFKLEDVLQ